MRLLICESGGGKSLLGFPEDEIVGVSDAKLHEIPGTDMGGIVHKGRIYVAVTAEGLFGGKRIGAFILMKRGYAVGVESIVGFEDLSEEIEVPEELVRYFRRAFAMDERLVFVVDDPSTFPPPPEDLERLEVEEAEETVEKEDYIVVKIGSEDLAVKLEELRGMTEFESVNRIEKGNLVGFIAFDGEVYPVVSRGRGNWKWVLVFEDVALACESFETVSGEIETTQDGEFLLVGGKRFPIAGGEEVRGWI